MEVPTGRRVLADRTRSQQVLANRLNDAIKYNRPRPGGEVRVEATWAGTAEVRLFVHDHGVDISAGELPRLLERLYRGAGSRSQPGSGLGLSLVRAVVEATVAGSRSPALPARDQPSRSCYLPLTPSSSRTGTPAPRGVTTSPRRLATIGHPGHEGCFQGVWQTDQLLPSGTPAQNRQKDPAKAR